MNKERYVLMPSTLDNLKVMGEQIKLARLRRNLSTTLVCQRAGISRYTLNKVEKGDPSVSVGIYANVLHALDNMDKDLLLVGKDDVLGKTIQDLNLKVRKRSYK